jgi:hypothetical protein
MSVGSFTAAGTRYQERRKISDSPEWMVEDMWKFDEKLLKGDAPHLRSLYAEHSARALAWLERMGVAFAGPYPEAPHRVPRMHNVIPNSKTYAARLLEAARKLKQWESAAEVASGLTKAGYIVSEQTMSNWKARWLSKECKLKSSAIIGFRIPWIEHRSGEMTERENEQTRTVLTVEEPLSKVTYFPEKHNTHPAIQEVIKLMSDTDELGKGMILSKARDISEERKMFSSKPKSST